MMLPKILSLVACLVYAAMAEDLSVYPISGLTPGDVSADVRQKNVQTTICVKGYTATVRDVPVALKRRVFQEYKIPWADRSSYEVDHLVSLELGGSNDIKNLWPQRYSPAPGAREKDVVENSLHRRVCSGEITLRRAQRIIASDWYGEYLRIKR